jgi:hypothetical protein
MRGGLRFEGLDCIGDVTSRNDVTFMFNGAFDDDDVVGVWNEGDDQVVFGDSFIQGLGIGDIEGLSSGILGVSNELLRFGERTASYNIRSLNQTRNSREINFRGKNGKNAGNVPTVIWFLGSRAR